MAETFEKIQLISSENSFAKSLTLTESAAICSWFFHMFYTNAVQISGLKLQVGTFWNFLVIASHILNSQRTLPINCCRSSTHGNFLFN